MEGLIILYAALIILTLVSMWIIFVKAGQPGWASIVPVYNLIIFMRIIDKPWWWIFLWMIPFAQLIWIIWGWNLLVRKFGKSEGFTVGVILLSFIFLPILAFGGATYEGREGQAPGSGTDPANKPDTMDTVLMIVIIFMFAAILTRFLLNVSHINPYAGFSKYIQFFFSFVSAFVPVVLALIVKSKSLKVLCIILGALYAVFMIISNIQMIKYMMPMGM